MSTRIKKPILKKLTGETVAQIKGMMYGQNVYCILTDKSRTAEVLHVGWHKEPTERLAEQYRTTGAPAVVKNAYVSGRDQISVFM